MGHKSWGENGNPQTKNPNIATVYTANIYSQTTASLQPNGCISDWITAIDSAQWLAVIQYSQITVLILSLTVIMNFFTYMGNSQTFGCNLAVQSKS